MLVRKTVTILFADVVDSTPLGERLDPEATRRIMHRWFDAMREAIERHGGTLEKFVGDEVMAVFGVPVVHEDDALRAVRAASEMRERLRALNGELERTFGVRLDMRVGINTGEVVAGDPAAGGTFVTGEPVVLAKRLQQAATGGEILIGKATFPLVRNAVSAGPLQTFSVKGKRDPASSRALHGVQADAPGIARQLDAPLIGRRAELARLRRVFDDAGRARACRVVTLIGPAGIGKSRASAELCAQLEDVATTATGRCVAYGDGITFRPLREIVDRIGGADGVRTALAGTEDAHVAADRVLGAVGLGALPGPPEETFWATRRLVEALGRTRPLVLVFEDLHWAEPTLLDLVEYLAGWVRDTPLLIVCIARPELLDARPSWATSSSDLVVLEPLSRDEIAALLDRIAPDLPSATCSAIAVAAEGNPLFVEQMAAHSVDREGEIVVPPSIQALLAERLDRLGERERTTIERASVIGRTFGYRAVAELCPPQFRETVTSHLLELARRGLVEPDVSASVGGDGFRFRHALIRDVAYAGLPKEIRAALHEQHAESLEKAAETPDEVLGYHLEQAAHYRVQLGAVDDATRDVARRAASALARAARRARAAGDFHSVAGLLTRATVLLRDEDRERVQLAPELARALWMTAEPERAQSVLDHALEWSAAHDDERVRGNVMLWRAIMRIERDVDDAVDELAKATSLLVHGNDEVALAIAAHFLGYADLVRGRYRAGERTLRSALGLAERGDDRREIAAIRVAIATALYWGPAHVTDAIALCEELLVAPDDRVLEAQARALLAGLLAMRGSFGEARAHARSSCEALEDLAAPHWIAGGRLYAGEVELLAGDAVAAEAQLRASLAAFEQSRGSTAEAAARLATALLVQGRDDEALEYAERAEASAGSDLLARTAALAARARLRARRGDFDEAAGAARSAIAIADPSDCLNARADAHAALAEALALRARDEATVELTRAASLYAAKGNEVGVAAVREAMTAGTAA